MTLEDKKTILGMCIGDGSVSERRNIKTNELHGRFSLTHSVKQCEYLEWKKRLLAKCLGVSVPETRIRLASTTGLYPQGTPRKAVEVCEFKKQHPYFKIIRRLLYPGGKKTITRHMLNKLNLLGLMMWYLDDGHLTTYFNNGKIRTVRLFITIGKPIEQVQIFVDYLKDVWGLRWTITKHAENSYRIGIGKIEGQKFLDLIRPIVSEEIPSMMYKIDPMYSPRVQRILAKENEAKIMI